MLQGFTEREFEAYLNLAGLTGRSLKWYIAFRWLNFENFIFQTFQTPAVWKTLKPHQALKHEFRSIFDESKSEPRKNPKTLSGIETPAVIDRDFDLQCVGKTLKPYEGLKRSIVLW